MKYYAAFFQAIKEKILESSPIETIAICSNSQVYDNDDFQLLSETPSLDNIANLREQLKLKEDLAYQFNSMSSQENSWEINIANNLFKKYKDILDVASTLSNSQQLSDLQNHLNILFDNNGKETADYKKYKTYLTKFEKAITDLDAHLQTWNESGTDASKLVWSEKWSILKNKLQVINSEWVAKGSKEKIAEANEKMNEQNEFNRFKQLVGQIKTDIALKENTGLESMENYIALQFIPYNFGTDSSKWTKIRLEKNELESFEKKFTVQNPFFSIDLNVSELYEQFTSHIDAEYCIVNINRNWLRKDIVNSPFLGQNSTTSYYPSKLIFIRNVNIELLPIPDDTKINLNNSFLKFGPLLLKNQIIPNKVSTMATLQLVTVKEVYKSKNFSKLNNDASTLNTIKIENKSLDSNPKSTIINKEVGKPIINPAFSARFSPQIHLNPSVIKPLVITPDKIGALPDTGQLILRVINKKNNQEAINKCEVSIIGLNNNLLKDVVSDENGELRVSLPLGQYQITLRKDGYDKLMFTQAIDKNNNIIVEKSLDPTNVVYNSIFLVGVCLDKMTT